jgi:hypothetical protein
MFHACVQRFDVTENLKILAKFLASKRCHRTLHNLQLGNVGGLVPKRGMHVSCCEFFPTTIYYYYVLRIREIMVININILYS